MKRITEFEKPRTVYVKVHEGSKDLASPELCELACEGVTSMEIVTGEDAEDYEEDFYDSDMLSDRYGEYLILHFEQGADIVYRRNDVDIMY